MGKYSDISITCNQCGKKFTFSEEEQDFYRTKGYTPPLRCKQCRSLRQQRSDGCSQCGNKLIEGAPQYCAACYIDVQLQFEQKAQELKARLEETESRLKAVEAENAGDQTATCRLPIAEAEKSWLCEETAVRIAAAEAENARLAELLKQKEDRILALEGRLDIQSSSLLAGLKDKIEVLERNQDNIIELLMKFLESNDRDHRSPGILDSLKSIFRSDRRLPS